MNGSVAERTHLMEYGVVGVFVHEALTERASQGRRVPVPAALLAILATTLVGALDEGIQAILPSRVFDPVDMLFNLLAAVMAVTASAALGPLRCGGSVVAGHRAPVAPRSGFKHVSRHDLRD